LKEVQQIEPRLYQDILVNREYITQNTFGEHSNLKPGEYRALQNFEIYDGYIDSRRGSKTLQAVTNPQRADVGFIKTSVVWDVGDFQYLIYFQGNIFFSQQVVTSIGNPVEIMDFAGAEYLIGSTDIGEIPDIFLEGGRLYIFHPAGNAVIEYDSSALKFKIRDMGMVSPKIDFILQTDAGNVSGRYTYGIEKVYRKAGGDVLGSSPNRKTLARVNATVAGIDKKFTINVDPTELENDTLWTHVRLWRSKTQISDLDDELNPIDPVGTEDELYEVALITRVEIEGGTVDPVTTSDDNLLPAGNVNTEAGQPGGAGTNFIITDDSTDEFLTLFVDLSGIELQPFPFSNVGTTHNDRIYISQLSTFVLSDGSTIAESVQDGVFYSERADSAYGEQFKASNFLTIELDGQKVTKLISFEKELIIVKEAKTLRLFNESDGTVEVLDQRIGTSDKRFLEFVPTLGICGRTNDYKDFRIFGFDFVWRSTFNGIEISKPVRNEMQGLVASTTNIIYINGKLMIGGAGGRVQILNVEQGLGWSEFRYLGNNTDTWFTFADNSRAGIAGGDEFLLEIEVEDLDTDYDTITEPSNVPIACLIETHQFRSNDGADVIEHEWLSIMGKIDTTMKAIPFNNDVSWPIQFQNKETNFVLDPSAYTIKPLNDREHRLFIEPEPQGIFLWNRMIGNFFHYRITTNAPCTLKSQRLHVIVDEDGIAWGEFDPYQAIELPVPGNGINETGVAPTIYNETGSAPTIVAEN